VEYYLHHDTHLLRIHERALSAIDTIPLQRFSIPREEGTRTEGRGVRDEENEEKEVKGGEIEDKDGSAYLRLE
jgi:hypothetical protein